MWICGHRGWSGVCGLRENLSRGRIRGGGLPAGSRPARRVEIGGCDVVLIENAVERGGGNGA